MAHSGEGEGEGEGDRLPRCICVHSRLPSCIREVVTLSRLRGRLGTVREQSNQPVIADGLSLRETTCSLSLRAQRSNLPRSVRRLVRREIASLRSQ
jgi:hypothetical protein